MAIDKAELETLKRMIRRAVNKGINVLDNWDTDFFIHKLKNHYGSTVKTSSGAFATVYIPSNKKYVIKIILKDCNDGYVYYAKYCLKNYKRIKHLPKVYAIFNIKEYTFFIIEKLKHNEKGSNKFEDNFTRFKDGGLRTNHKLYKFFNLLERKFGYYGINDIGGNNVMVRKNGTIVLTDPIAD